MDLETLFYIAIAALYLLSRLGGKKKKKQRPAPPAPARQPSPNRPAASSRPARSAELDDALREIRAALGWELPEPEPAPPPAPAPPPTQTSRPAKALPPAHWEEASRPEWTAPAETVQEAARWDATRPKTPPARTDPMVKPGRVTTIPATSTTLTGVSESRQPARVEEIRKLLRNPSSAREAFLLTEIFARRGRR